MSNKVVFAQLHDGFFLPGNIGGGQFTNSLPPANKTLKNFDMERLEDGSLLMTWHEGKFKKRVIIGSATVKVVVLEAEELKLKPVESKIVPVK